MFGLSQFVQRSGEIVPEREYQCPEASFVHVIVQIVFPITLEAGILRGCVHKNRERSVVRIK